MSDVPERIATGDPAATPRIQKRGEAKRERPIFREERDGWSVIVTPIELGRKVSFEVRADFRGPTLPEFEHSRREQAERRETWQTPDAEGAQAVARAATDRLRAGDRDLFLPAIAAELGHEKPPAGWPEGLT